MVWVTVRLNAIPVAPTGTTSAFTTAPVLRLRPSATETRRFDPPVSVPGDGTGVRLS